MYCRYTWEEYLGKRGEEQLEERGIVVPGYLTCYFHVVGGDDEVREDRDQ